MVLNLFLQSSLVAGQFDSHVIPEKEFQSELAAKSAQRIENMAEVQKFNDQLEAGMPTWGWIVIAAAILFAVILLSVASFVV
jgi:hypothetical protein